MRDLRETARDLGLDRLSDEHLAQLGRALETMARHLQRLPRDLPASDELALIFRAQERS
ncbi:MAG TPA: hypothetical protein VE397_11145 [Stellaceae bacterium]|nr:hypothetical protein [Stellaceae bacterium]